MKFHSCDDRQSIAAIIAVRPRIQILDDETSPRNYPQLWSFECPELSLKQTSLQWQRSLSLGLKTHNASMRLESATDPRGIMMFVFPSVISIDNSGSYSSRYRRPKISCKPSLWSISNTFSWNASSYKGFVDENANLNERGTMNPSYFSTTSVIS